MPKNYSEIYASVYTNGNSMSFGNAMLRGNGVPLDITEVYDSYEAAVNYAANNPVAYEGQLIAVTENGDTTVYVITPKSQGIIEIDPDMDGVSQEVDVYIKEVGSMPTADGVTIELVDGALKLVGLSGLDAEKTYQPVLVNGKLQWQEPSATTVEGLDTRLSAAEESINALETAVGNEESGLTKDVADARAAAAENAANITKLGDEYAQADEALKTNLEAQIATALADAKKYADDNDADTAYDDTDIRALLQSAQDAIDTVAGDLSAEVDAREKADTDLETALKAYVGQEIGKQAHFSAKVVTSTDEMTDSTTLYLVKAADAGEDLYEEWMLIDGTPVKIGTTATDLTDYVTTTDLNGKLSTQKSELEGQISAVSDTHAQDKEALTNQISAVSTELSSFKSDVETTYETKTAVAERATELQTAIDNLATEVGKKADASISGDISAAADAAAAAQAKAGQNAEAIVALQSADEELSGRIGTLESVGAEKNVIASVSDEFSLDAESRALSVNKISVDKIDGLRATLDDHSDRINNKVEKVSTEYEGAMVAWTLLSPENQAKLAALTVGDSGNIELSGKVTAENVDGLGAFLTQNRDTIPGLLAAEDEAKLDGIEAGAQTNVIEEIKIGNTALLPSDKTVTIPFATQDAYGVVLSSTGVNTVAVKDDGTMEVNSLSVTKLQQEEGDTLILNCGTSTV